jgi:hypothetical protein
LVRTAPHSFISLTNANTTKHSMKELYLRFNCGLSVVSGEDVRTTLPRAHYLFCFPLALLYKKFKDSLSGIISE